VFLVKDIAGITPEAVEMLNALGIETMEQFIDAAAQNSNRAELSQKTGIPEAALLKWVNRAENRIMMSKLLKQ